MEYEQEKRTKPPVRRPIREPDGKLIEGQKQQQAKPEDSAGKYSGGLLKAGQGEHFEREQARLNRYQGIDATPGTGKLEERLYGKQPAQQQGKAKGKSSCLGVLLLAAAGPAAALIILLSR